MKVTELEYKMEKGRPVFSTKTVTEKSFIEIEGVKESFKRLNNKRLLIRKRVRVSGDSLSTRFF